jgi:hypothetical protein
MTDYWWESGPSASLGMTPCEVIGRARKDAPARTVDVTKCAAFSPETQNPADFGWDFSFTETNSSLAHREGILALTSRDYIFRKISRLRVTVAFLSIDTALPRNGGKPLNNWAGSVGFWATLICCVGVLICLFYGIPEMGGGYVASPKCHSLRLYDNAVGSFIRRDLRGKHIPVLDATNDSHGIFTPLKPFEIVVANFDSSAYGSHYVVRHQNARRAIYRAVISEFLNNFFRGAELIFGVAGKNFNGWRSPAVLDVNRSGKGIPTLVRFWIEKYRVVLFSRIHESAMGLRPEIWPLLLPEGLLRVSDCSFGVIGQTPELIYGQFCLLIDTVRTEGELVGGTRVFAGCARLGVSGGYQLIRLFACALGLAVIDPNIPYSGGSNDRRKNYHPPIGTLDSLSKILVCCYLGGAILFMYCGIFCWVILDCGDCSHWLDRWYSGIARRRRWEIVVIGCGFVGISVLFIGHSVRLLIP